MGAPSAKTDRNPWPLATSASLSPRLQNLYSSVQGLPVLGRLARSVASRVLPRGCRVWTRPPAGLAQGLLLNLDPRFEREYAQGLYEPAIQKALAEQLRGGGTFYDVGAHIGFFSLIAARLVGKSGAVYAFEADPANAARIERQVHANGFPQIEVIPSAVWSRSEVLRFQRASEFSSHNQGSVVATRGGADNAAIIEVSALSLDEFAQDHKSPTLLKIDVEGGEAEVLRGAEQLFSDAKPALICEVHDPQSMEFIESYLAEKQYSLKWLHREDRFPRHLLAQPFPKGN
jgi:FkbM family methyltransferase